MRFQEFLRTIGLNLDGWMVVSTQSCDGVMTRAWFAKKDDGEIIAVVY
jgi:hypothetical protein